MVLEDSPEVPEKEPEIVSRPDAAAEGVQENRGGGRPEGKHEVPRRPSHRGEKGLQLGQEGLDGAEGEEGGNERRHFSIPGVLVKAREPNRIVREEPLPRREIEELPRDPLQEPGRPSRREKRGHFMNSLSFTKGHYRLLAVKLPRRSSCAAAIRALLWIAVSAQPPGCSSTSEPATGDILLDLEHRDPRVRILASERIVSEGKIELAPRLVKNLADPDGAVRMFAAVALRKLTGQDFGYKPFGLPSEQAEAVNAWNAWLASDGYRAQVEMRRRSGEGDVPGTGDAQASAPSPPQTSRATGTIWREENR